MGLTGRALALSRGDCAENESFRRATIPRCQRSVVTPAWAEAVASVSAPQGGKNRWQSQCSKSEPERPDMPRPNKPDPYCAFKDDRERRKALIARDVRLTLIGVTGTLAATAVPWQDLLLWLRHLAG